MLHSRASGPDAASDPAPDASLLPSGVRRPASGDPASGRLCTVSVEREKQVAAEAAAEFVEDGMAVGLGTGSTVAYLLPALARRRLSIRCVATSPRTEKTARELGLDVEPLGTIDQ